MQYRFQTGQEIVCRTESSCNVAEIGSRAQTHIIVLGENSDGSWHLLVSRRPMPRDPAQGKDAMDWAGLVTFGCHDVFPDGRFAAGGSQRFLFDPASLLPPLPENGTVTDEGWERFDEETETHRRCTPVTRRESPGNVSAFRISTKVPYDEIYLLKMESTAFFDSDKGLIVRIEGQDEQGWSSSMQWDHLTTLQSVELHDADWAAQLRREADAYLGALSDYGDLMSRAEIETGQTDALLSAAEALLAKALKESDMPLIREPVTWQIGRHDLEASFCRQRSQNRAERIGRAAPGWEFRDLEGSLHSLTAYRGQVLVLDFWYRGCMGCVWALPQVNEVAEHFADKPVRVLGMNLHDNEESARLVVENRNVTFPTLMAKGLDRTYGINAYPSYVIIDGAGMIREILGGFSPDKLIKSVEAILAET